MQRRVTVCRLANGISQLARKVAGDPELAAELLPQLKALVRQLEEAGKE